MRTRWVTDLQGRRIRIVVRDTADRYDPASTACTTCGLGEFNIRHEVWRQRAPRKFSDWQHPYRPIWAEA